MSFKKMTVYEMSFDEMTIDKTAMCSYQFKEIILSLAVNNAEMSIIEYLLLEIRKKHISMEF
jgi:hypothetical protein